jgi:methyl-accepting chemotaxis protein
MTTVAIGSEEQEMLDTRIFARRAQFALNTSRLVGKLGPIFVVLTAILWWFFRQYPQLLAIPILTLLPTTSARLYPVLHSRGQGRIGIVLLLLSTMFNLFVIFPLVPEIMLSVTILYVFLIMLAYLLLDVRDGHWIAGACILAFGINIVLTHVWQPTWRFPLSETTALITSAFMGTSIMLCITVIIRQLMVEQEMLFRRSQLANLEIEKRAAVEENLRKHLQTVAQEYVEYMTRVGRGDLTARLPLSEDGRGTQDPLIALGHSLNQMVTNLQGMSIRIQDAASGLSASAAEILASTTQQVSGAHGQSAAISQTTTTVEEVKAIAEQSVEWAREVVNMSERTVEVSRSGKDAMAETIVGMSQIKERVEGIAENIVALLTQAQRIGEIIATVDEIAAQSNVLALNASVEAARAGEYGKGFAVVAVEVRNLARQSQQATEQVRGILLEVQKGISAVVATTEEGTKVVEEGARLVEQAQKVIAQLGTVIEESAQVARQMAAGGRQQVSGVEQIATAMQNISQATVHNLASTRQAEKAASDLNDLARDLTETVAQYRL